MDQRNIEILMSRFMEKAAFIDPDDCWVWIGSSPRGYGQFWNGAKVVRAHRWIYETLIEPVPAGLVLDHLCRNTYCVNPTHLEPVTQQVNTLRGRGLAAKQARQTLCIHGHPLTGDNLYVKPNGARQCKACRRATDKRRPRHGDR